MASNHLEVYAYALKAAILSSAGTVLTAMQTQLDDGIILDNFEEVKVGYKNVFGQRAYPVCYIYPGKAGWEEYAMSAELVEFRLELWFAVTDKDPEALTKKLMRYINALKEVVNDNSTLDGAVVNAAVIEAEFWPGGPDNSSVGAGRVVVRLRTEERN